MIRRTFLKTVALSLAGYLCRFAEPTYCHPETTRERLIPGKTKEFRLMSITYHGEQA